MRNFENPNIVVVGGGTGTSNILNALKHKTESITAIVNMSDDGGSSGILRRRYGVMPPGDIRQCLVALSTDAAYSKLFNRRIRSGPAAGHTFGNLLLVEREIALDSFEASVDYFSKDLEIVGSVLPVTLDRHELRMRDKGEFIRGEYKIAHRPFNEPVSKDEKPTIWLSHGASLNPRTEQALLEADIIAFAPGNNYGSVLPTVAVPGFKEAVEDSSATKVMFTNITNMRGQTDGWHTVDHALTLEDYIGMDSLDYIIYNTDVPAADKNDLIAINAEEPVGIEPRRFDETRAVCIGAKLLEHTVALTSVSDHLIERPRSRVRHNAAALAEFIMNLPGIDRELSTLLTAGSVRRTI